VEHLLAIELDSWTSPSTIIVVLVVIYAFLPTFISQLRKAWKGDNVLPPDVNIADIIKQLEQNTANIGVLTASHVQLIQAVQQGTNVANSLIPLANQIRAGAKATVIPAEAVQEQTVAVNKPPLQAIKNYGSLPKGGCQT
jgi:hypothetical protein